MQKRLDNRFLIVAVVVGVLMVLGSCAAMPEPPATREEATSVEYVGTWEGNLAVQGQEIQIVVRFFEEPPGNDESEATRAGNPVASMDIPAQLAFDLPLSHVRASGNAPGSAVHFELVTGGPTFVADLVVDPGDTESGSMTGSFTQGPATGEIALVRTGDLETPSLTDDTSSVDPEPRRYAEQTVEIQTDGPPLAGTFLLPEGDGPFPLALIVAGSGPTDRDGNSRLLPGRNDGLRELAEALSNRGIATLRYDKRGVGESLQEGYDPFEDTFDDFVNDFLAWFEWANDNPQVSSVYPMGHSEGGIVVLAGSGSDSALVESSGINASQAELARGQAGGLVLIAAPSKPLDLVAIDQIEASLGPDSPVVSRAREVAEAIRAGETVTDLPRELVAVFNSAVQPYLRSIAPFDPSELIRNVGQPVLAIGGTEDLQIPSSHATALAEAGDPATSVIVSGMNHVLKLIPEGDLTSNRRSYTDPSFHVPAELVDVIADFVTGPR